MTDQKLRAKFDKWQDEQVKDDTPDDGETYTFEQLKEVITEAKFQSFLFGFSLAKDGRDWRCV